MWVENTTSWGTACFGLKIGHVLADPMGPVGCRALLVEHRCVTAAFSPPVIAVFPKCSGLIPALKGFLPMRHWAPQSVLEAQEEEKSRVIRSRSDSSASESQLPLTWCYFWKTKHPESSV